MGSRTAAEWARSDNDGRFGMPTPPELYVQRATVYDWRTPVRVLGRS